MKPCFGDLWGFGCQIPALRDKKETIHVDLCVRSHPSICVCVRARLCVCLRHVDGCSEAVAEAASSHRYLILVGFVM